MNEKFGIEIGDNLSDEEFSKKAEEVLLQLKNTMTNHMDRDTAIKLLYWLNDWGFNYLKNENTFPYNDLIRYKRGSVVEANLGFKVGSEQGGLHYCIVLDNRNSKTNKVLLVVPLESLPNNKKPENIDPDYEVFLGYGIFKEDIEKLKKEIEKINNKIMEKQKQNLETTKLKKTMNKLNKELIKLQKGSVAQIAQTCSLSKMRIYNPKNIGDKFSNFQLDEDKIIEIEQKFAKLYLNKTIAVEKK